MRLRRSTLISLASFGIGLFVCSNAAVAWQSDNFLSNFYLGGDLQARHMSFKAGYGHNLFRNHFTQGNFYGGIKFNCFTSLEFGYEEGRTNNRQTTLDAGEAAAGVVIPPELAPAIFRNSSRVSGYHLDWVGYFSKCEEDPFKYIASFGFAYARAAFIRRTVQVADLEMSTVRLFTRRRLVARAMVGGQYQFMPNLSVRGTLTWENTKGLKSNSASSSSVFIAQVKPEDSIIAGVGLVWNF